MSLLSWLVTEKGRLNLQTGPEPGRKLKQWDQEADIELELSAVDGSGAAA